MVTPLYKRIEKMRKHRIEHNLPIDFETINDVLKRLKSPSIIDRDQNEIHYNNAEECFQDLKKKPNLFPKPVVAKVWNVLSELIASNATGDLKIMDGAADDYGRLKADKVFIAKELPRLMKNKNLSEDTKKLLKRLRGKYGTHFNGQYSKMKADIKNAKDAICLKLK